MPQWFVSFEPSTRASTFMGSVKNKLVDLSLIDGSWLLLLLGINSNDLFLKDIKKHSF